MNKLVKVNIHPVLATEYGQEIEESCNMEAGNIALFVSCHGQSQSLVGCSTILKSKGVPAILVTGEGSNPLMETCTLVLPVRLMRNFAGAPVFIPASAWSSSWMSCFPYSVSRTAAGSNDIKPCWMPAAETMFAVSAAFFDCRRNRQPE
ncbi:hypothetical protein [Faecalibaculum rodentium]|uniref:hypothetical protein n=1 Tax=Faecalibaculum rodentium TaxID=1702221 RepID=UPI0026F38BDB|nr:hypothetical protein [Faecalibaculum rodentium]